MESMEIVAMQKEETGGELRRNLLMTIPEQNNKFLKGDSKESNCVLVLRLAMRLAQSEAETAERYLLRARRVHGQQDFTSQ